MSNDLARRGLMFVLSSPSGAGKTSLARALLESDPNLQLSISATTRPRRPNEVEGRDYVFVDEAAFRARVAAHEFLEHAEVFGRYYGTPKAPVLAALEAGRDVLFDIDWQGTQQLRQQARGDLVSVFVLPPSRAELERRLRARAQDSEETIRARMAKADAELSHWAEYDYVVVNDAFDPTLGKLRQILAAERLRRERRLGLADFVRGLMS